VTKREPAPHTHALTELGDGLGVPADLRRHLADLTPDYTITRYPDAANAVPYELYDASTALTKVENAGTVIAWLRSKIGS
jgi:HEPN domain-containing protein